ncbi:MAG TPA: SulP family inorganic anion transporter [Candidatus Melainabacteria bacterium]|nr:SulP family inorganic anion transporter [Candidatus Melainabacteria bacterium]HIN66896.1 SulP family inorganic anion transporter [Candidatus Obscuribacterales bacterium]
MQGYRLDFFCKEILMYKSFFCNWKGDITGGIMTTVVALPVAMAFGVASGLGAAAGLYGAMSCGLLAGIFGGTRGQQSGPTGPIAVVVAAMLVAHHDRRELVFAATIIAGLLQVVFGKLRFGELVRYFPYPVVSGFMTGIALIIIFLHINPLFGIAGNKDIILSLKQIPAIPTSMNLAALLIGLSTILISVCIKQVSKHAPAALLALAATSAVTVILKLDIPRIGEIPNQLPLPQLPAIGVSDLYIVLAGALTISVLGSIDSLLTSLIADKMLREHHNSNKELIGQGIGNMAAGLIGGLPGAGSTTRTIANIDAGGRGALAGVIYGTLIFSVIAFFGNIAAVIPLSALAGILISLGFGIIDWRAFKDMRAAPKADTCVMLTVLILTVAFDLISAVLIGTALACVFFAKRVSDSKLARGKTLDTIYEYLEPTPGSAESSMKKALVYAFSGPIFFGETKNLTEIIRALDKEQTLIFDFVCASSIDVSCCYYLEDAIAHLRKCGNVVILLGLHGEIEKTLQGMACESVLDEAFMVESLDDLINILPKANSETRFSNVAG